MSPRDPLITIVTPTRNRSSLLRETLDSVASQTEARWECIVCDDGSSDDTCQIVSRLSRQDDRFRLSPPEAGKSGANAARSRGLRQARGDFVIFLDSDDLLMPDCLSRRLAAIHSTPDLDFVASCAEIFRERPGDEGILFTLPTIRSELVRYFDSDSPFQTASIMFRANYLRRHPDWREGLRRWQDCEYYIRLLLKNPRYLYSPEVDFYFRSAVSRPSLGTDTHDIESIISVLEAQRELLPEVRRYSSIDDIEERFDGLHFSQLQQLLFRSKPLARRQFRLSLKAGMFQIRRKLISTFFALQASQLLTRVSYKFIYPQIVSRETYQKRKTYNTLFSRAKTSTSVTHE